MKRECSYSETFPLLLIIKFSALIFFSSIFYSFILLLCSASLPSSHSLFFIMYFFVRRNEEVRGGRCGLIISPSGASRLRSTACSLRSLYMANARRFFWAKTFQDLKIEGPGLNPCFALLLA